MDSGSGSSIAAIELSGPPDVVFLNPALARLYVAIGEPGVIDVVDVAGLERVEVVATEDGCHTIGFDQATNRVYAFCPRTHRALVYAEDA
jgi:DNA-binding beta-propeller fold protein YncE